MMNNTFYNLYKKYSLNELFIVNKVLWLNEDEPYRRERIKVVQAIINSRIKERNFN